jgi:hypothetical protein
VDLFPTKTVMSKTDAVSATRNRVRARFPIFALGHGGCVATTRSRDDVSACDRDVEPNRGDIVHHLWIQKEEGSIDFLAFDTKTQWPKKVEEPLCLHIPRNQTSCAAEPRLSNNEEK